jgi:hypothetical protein
MTRFQDAVNWFYHWEHSEIVGTGLEQRLLEIFNPSLAQDDRARLVRDLVHEHEDSPLMPELLVQLGVRYRRLGIPQSGIAYITRAIEIYTQIEDIHHLNCLHWLHGCLLWQTGSKLSACIQWRKAIAGWTVNLPILKYSLSTLDQEIENARLAVLRCIELGEWHRKEAARAGMAKHRQHIAEYERKAQQWQTKLGELQDTRHALSIKQDWYGERLREMGIALLCKPEEAYLLVKDLTLRQPDRLSQGFIAQREAIEKQIAENRPTQVGNEVDGLMAGVEARSPIEKAEAFLVNGLAMHAIKRDRWEKDLQKATFLSPPDTLLRVWARWLLGAIQWVVPKKRGDAAMNWNIAIQDLAHMKTRAEWQNQAELVRYSAEKLALMQGALELQRNNLAVPAQEGA